MNELFEHKEKDVFWFLCHTLNSCVCDKSLLQIVLLQVTWASDLQLVHNRFSFQSLLLKIFVFFVSLSVSQCESADIHCNHLLDISV